MRLPWKRSKRPLTNAEVRKLIVKAVNEAQVSLDTEHRTLVDIGAHEAHIKRNRRRWRQYEACRTIPVGTAVLRLHSLAYDCRPIGRYITANPVENGSPSGRRSPGLRPTLSRAQARRIASGRPAVGVA